MNMTLPLMNFMGLFHFLDEFNAGTGERHAESA